MQAAVDNAVKALGGGLLAAGVDGVVAQLRHDRRVRLVHRSGACAGGPMMPSPAVDKLYSGFLWRCQQLLQGGASRGLCVGDSASWLGAESIQPRRDKHQPTPRGTSTSALRSND